MAKKKTDLDDAMNSINELEERESKERAGEGAVSGTAASGGYTNKIEIGEVEQYFSKIGVAAVRLKSHLSVGDIIEVGSEEEHVRQRVSSMQIDRKDVEEAFEGDDVGIKMRHPVSVGESIFRVEV
jgi:hypothetical protein